MNPSISSMMGVSMLSFMRDYRLVRLKIKFLIIYMLNVTDIAFTVLLLNTGYYREANTVMIKVVQSQLSSLLVKILMPAFLLLLLYYRMQSANENQLKKSNYLINGMVVFYAMINAFHLCLLGLYPLILMVFKV